MVAINLWSMLFLSPHPLEVNSCVGCLSLTWGFRMSSKGCCESHFPSQVCPFFLPAQFCPLQPSPHPPLSPKSLYSSTNQDWRYGSSSAPELEPSGVPLCANYGTFTILEPEISSTTSFMIGLWMDSNVHSDKFLPHLHYNSCDLWW